MFKPYGYIRSGYGDYLHPRGRIDGYKHAGIDVYPSSDDLNVYSPVPGVVVYAGSEPIGYGGYGPCIIIMITREGYYHLFAHLNNVFVDKLSTIEIGNKIGSVENKFDHIHYEVRTTQKINKPNPWQKTVNPIEYVSVLNNSYPKFIGVKMSEKGWFEKLIDDAKIDALKENASQSVATTKASTPASGEISIAGMNVHWAVLGALGIGAYYLFIKK